jgi:hypothetical protein
MTLNRVSSFCCRATVVYDRSPEFFHPISLIAKHEVSINWNRADVPSVFLVDFYFAVPVAVLKSSFVFSYFVGWTQLSHILLASGIVVVMD